ncbi:hypothetical protein Rt10032_c15g5412 [Rhodotorula toruloides]|uniref:Uncharacterized protein n=1 Tax=Rhodotorula toruloides TaxID=5286 RepID=A0A511KNB0_RHOTO|nr:hypothetical protein Rt10032_c15g5412 [Rhodotorula toruloides]
MPFPPLVLTRDLLHFRKVPARQTALLSVANSFLALLTSSDNPSSPSLRSIFLPALTATDSRPSSTAALDAHLLNVLGTDTPQIVLLQTVPTVEQVEAAWKEGQMGGRIFVGAALNNEFERAKEEDARDEVANLSIMVIATLAYELAQWIYVKTHGYTPPDYFSDTSSLRTTHTTHSISVSSIHSTGSSSGTLLVPHRNKDDVGTRAVLALLGYDLELVTYAIGSRQLIKRRYPTRRSPILTPPILFALIGDTAGGILDCTSMNPTVSGMVPPHHRGDSMYAVTSVLTPAGLAKVHGTCVVNVGGDAGGVKVSLEGGREGAEEEKVYA